MNILIYIVLIYILTLIELILDALRIVKRYFLLKGSIILIKGGAGALETCLCVYMVCTFKNRRVTYAVGLIRTTSTLSPSSIPSCKPMLAPYRTGLHTKTRHY
jgi:hypothetical protein